MKNCNQRSKRSKSNLKHKAALSNNTDDIRGCCDLIEEWGKYSYYLYNINLLYFVICVLMNVDTNKWEQ